jgi:hypothetical protein
MGAAGRRLVERDYDWAAIVNRWLDELRLERIVAGAAAG